MYFHVLKLTISYKTITTVAKSFNITLLIASLCFVNAPGCGGHLELGCLKVNFRITFNNGFLEVSLNSCQHQWNWLNYWSFSVFACHLAVPAILFIQLLFSASFIKLFSSSWLTNTSAHTQTWAKTLLLAFMVHNNDANLFHL